jgi:MFS family permease
MSISQQAPASDPEADTRNPDHYKVGTLSYTKAGLITLFVFLLWGDFCFTLMEIVVPSIMPLKFNAIGAPNWSLGLIVTTIPNLMNTVINPFVSFRSDRFRGKWGRRIPFLAGATPFLVIFLVLLGYSDSIAHWVQASIMGGKGSSMVVLLMVIGLFMVCFQFFNLFITSVYYYLFNDVVPQAFLARFMSLFRMVGTGAGASYNFFVYKYANTHMKEIFLVAGLLYFIAFVMMCWKVREGAYPPPPPNLDNQTGLKSSIRTYAKECFTHPFYWYFFLANTFGAMTWASGSYGVLVATKVVGVDLDLFGKVGGTCGIISLILLYPAGIIADRFHPVRVVFATSIIGLTIMPFSIAFIFICHSMPPHAAIRAWIFFSAIGLPTGTLAAASEFPMYMRLLPKERYGQFCSANALIRSIALIAGGVGCGAFLDFARRFGTRPDDCYRFVSIWNAFFVLGSFSFFLLLYREWRRLGGLSSYVPPQVELPCAETLVAPCEPVA